MVPEELRKFRPKGRAGEMAYLRGATPPVATTGMKAATEDPLTKVIWGLGAEADIAELLMTREKEAEAEAPVESVTDTVKVEADPVAVGVPEIAPVREEKESPAGSAGATE